MIGLIDSGVGGLSVLIELLKLAPYIKYSYIADFAFSPYGNKPKDILTDRLIYLVNFLIEKGSKLVVLACNTATSASVKILRNLFDIPIIGMEPAIKPAINISKSKSIIVLATPNTIEGDKYKKLEIKFLNGTNSNKIINLPLQNLVKIIENSEDIYKIEKSPEFNKIITSIDKIIIENNVDVIVFGCTHFTLIESLFIKTIKSDVNFISGNFGTAKHTINVYKKLKITEDFDGIKLNIFSSDFSSFCYRKLKFWLEFLIRRNSISENNLKVKWLYL